MALSIFLVLFSFHIYLCSRFLDFFAHRTAFPQGLEKINSSSLCDAGAVFWRVKLKLTRPAAGQHVDGACEFFFFFFCAVETKHCTSFATRFLMYYNPVQCVFAPI